MTKTNTQDSKTPEGRWFIFDASEFILGKLAVEVATRLMDKDLPTFNPAVNTDTHVVVINAAQIKFTGKKAEQKRYYRHSRYPGGLKDDKLGELLEKRPEEVIRKAVLGMLPKNRLQNMRIKRLHTYGDDKHPHAGQAPEVINAK